MYIYIYTHIHKHTVRQIILRRASTARARPCRGIRGPPRRQPIIPADIPQKGPRVSTTHISMRN